MLVDTDNDMINTNSESFLDKICDDLANIGAFMSKNIPQTIIGNSFFKLYGKRCLQSPFLDVIDEKEVSSYVNSIKANSASGSTKFLLSL